MVGRFKKALLEKGDMSGMTQRGGHKRSTESGAGLTQKGVEKYRRQNPGSKLKTAVTTPPSKLKPGSKAAKRRKSFCARSRGWTGERGKAARRRWNCSTDANPNALQQIAEMILYELKCWKGYKRVKGKTPGTPGSCVKKTSESDDPRMKTTSASIQQGGGDPEQYKKEKAAKDPKPAGKKTKKTPKRRAAMGRGGGKYRRQRIQPPKGHEGPSAPTQQISVAGDAEGEQKKIFKKGTVTKPMSKKQVDRMGVRGQEKKIADQKKKMARKTGAANIQLMRDLGVLKTDSKGRVTLAKKRR